MADDEAFLRAILDDPDDVSTRMVYADWLIEQGDERGEFIHVQCRAEAHGEGTLERWDQQERAELLLERNRRAWTEPLRKAGVRSYDFRRGFVEDVTINAGKSLGALDKLFELYPIRTLKFRSVKTREQVEQIGKCRQLEWIETLDLTGANMSGGRARILLGSPFLKDLPRLLVSSNSLGQAGARAIAEVGWTRLHTLNVASTKLDSTAVRLLVDGLPASLRHLNLGANFLDDESIIAITQLPNLAHLESLDLSAPIMIEFGTSPADEAAVTIESARALTSAPFATTMRSFKMRFWSMGSAANALIDNVYGSESRV